MWTRFKPGRGLLVALCAGWAMLVIWLIWLSALGAIHVSEYSFRRLLGGPGYLVAQHLRALPPAQREAGLQALQRQFQFPLSLVARDDVDLAPESDVMLANGLAVQGSSEEIAYYALDEKTLIQMGPMWGSAAMEDVMRQPVFLLAGGACFIPLLLLSLFMWQRRRQRERAMAALIHTIGDMARTPATVLQVVDAEWAPLVEALRQHARQVGAMAERHKEVSQAVSHELRTPLARMRFALALLGRDADQDTRVRLQQRLLRDVGQLEGLVRASLAFARLADAPAVIGHERIALRAWLEEEVAALDGGRCGATLAVTVEDDEFYGDRSLLHLVLRNLLDNAARHGHSQVRLEAHDHGAGQLLLQVDDDGPGIAYEDQERIFEPFVRLSAEQDSGSENDAGGSFGLGLALVKRALHWQQGEIQVSRSPLGGARFSVMLPRRRL
ncbi:two-component sensor histidine kinase [Duganella sp. CY15W]|uniref:ATP-binding protein n=1 Tax=Duganella sp. CY15W TaxID=2692172 RepID=UPI00136BE148|nr:ATP-binding protein [Duganella sp. CY15W]MYM28712.1 two-component sensor histidine kinase [Duganella sp. CY15W]